MKDLIKKLTLAFGVSGFENEISEIIREELGSISDISKDKIGNIYCKMKNGKRNPKIVFIAHMDEIGFMVSDILPSGHLKLQTIGGWNPATLQSSKVIIKTNTGKRIVGIIGSIPVHFLGKNQSLPKTEDMFVDIGATSYQDVLENFQIRLGDPVIPYTDFHFSNQNNRIFSKAFDDRIGVAAMIETAKQITEHPNEVLFIGSVQEEVGARGSIVVSHNVDADAVIVLEGAPADDFPFSSKKPQTAVGNGAHIRLYDPSMIANKELAKFIIHTAEKNNIKYQVAVRKSGGTDGRYMHTAFMGIPAIVLGVPVRYAHSHNGVISLDDFRNLVDLLNAFIMEFDEEAAAKLTD